MKKLLITTALLSSALILAGCQEKPATTPAEAAPEAPAVQTAAKVIGEAKIVDAGCGMCTYKVEGVSKCETWVNIDNKKLKVTGVEHSAHKSGLCKAGKHEAKVTGAIEGDKFVATSIAVIKADSAPDDHAGHDH